MTLPFCVNSGAGFKIFLAALAFAALVALAPAQQCLARSASAPRHSGLEPPGGPRPIEGLPSRSPSRTAEGGMGYTDAYGNTVRDSAPEEKKARQRPRPGAYGGYAKSREAPRGLPEGETGPPLWKF